MFRRIAVALMLAAAGVPAANAEIVESTGTDRKGEPCQYWWPKLSVLPGWYSDPEVNRSIGGNGANVLIPNGMTFKDADTILYASATLRKLYVKNNPASTTLEAFISDDKAHFLEKDEETFVLELEPLTTRDGRKLRSFAFIRPKSRNWERVSYSEEGGFYVVFVLNAQSEEGYRKGQADYESFVGQYSAK